MSEHVESVKRVAAYLRDVAEKNSGRDDVVSRVIVHAEALDAAANHITGIEDLMTAVPPDLGRISDLPEELLEELSVAKTDDLEDQLVTVINACNGEATLDQILVGLYRKFKIIQKRRFVQNKLYRMEMVWSVPGKKGVYTTEEQKTVDQMVEDTMHTEEHMAVRDLDSEIPF